MGRILGESDGLSTHVFNLGLPTLDWAAEVAKREDVAVVSGFHSRMEREVLE